MYCLPEKEKVEGCVDCNEFIVTFNLTVLKTTTRAMVDGRRLLSFWIYVWRNLSNGIWLGEEFFSPWEEFFSSHCVRRILLRVRRILLSGEKNSSHGEKEKKSSHGEKNSSHMRKNFLTFLTLRFRLKISLTESGAGWRESFLTRHNKEMFK